MPKKCIIGTPNLYKKGGPVIKSRVQKRDGEQPEETFIGEGLHQRTYQQSLRDRVNPNPNPARERKLPSGPAQRVKIKKHVARISKRILFLMRNRLP